MNKRVQSLIVRAQLGQDDSLSVLLEENKGLIWSIVKRFIGRGYEVEDIYQIACIGFIEAIQRFDFDYGVELSTYSVQYMLGEIKKFIRDDGIIRVSRGLKELGIKIKELEKIYLNKTGESLNVKRLSEILEISEDTVCMAMDAFQSVESINETNEDGKEKVEFIVSDEDEQSKIVDKITIKELIRKLNFREKEIITLRYFKDKTQSQVAKILGISQVHVSRLEKKVLNEFKESLLV